MVGNSPVHSRDGGQFEHFFFLMFHLRFIYFFVDVSLYDENYSSFFLNTNDQSSILTDSLENCSMRSAKDQTNNLTNPLYASYDEVYVSSEEGAQNTDSLHLNSLPCSKEPIHPKHELFYASSSQDDTVNGCMTDLFKSPIVGRKKKRKRNRKKNSLTGGIFQNESSDSDDLSALPSRSSISTNLSYQVSKLLSTKGEIHPRKLNIVHPQLRSDTNRSPPTRSLLVRTLTLPLKLASQKRPILSRSISKSQPTSPEIIRKVNPNNEFPKRCESFSYHNKNENSGSSSKSVYNYKRDSFLPPIPIINVPDDKLVFHVCDKCAKNVEQKIQHPSIWAHKSHYEFDPPKAALEDTKTKSNKDDCKLQ